MPLVFAGGKPPTRLFYAQNAQISRFVVKYAATPKRLSRQGRVTTRLSWLDTPLRHILKPQQYARISCSNAVSPMFLNVHLNALVTEV